MGASHSGHSRSVNMENPTPIGVIDVSDEVVQRLKVGLAKNEKAKQASQPTSSQPQPETSKPTNVPNPYSKLPAPSQQQPSVMYTEPSISSMEVRRQKEIELQQNDIYWRKRLAQLEQTLNKTNTIMEKEYTQAIGDVRKSFTNAPAIHQLPPCQNIKANLIACYRANPNESLKCSDEVMLFMNCVSENRVKKLDAAADQALPKQTPASIKPTAAKVVNETNKVPPKAA